MVKGLLGITRKYLDWLQKDVPVGEVEKYPVIDARGETSVKGIFVIGDLTGIPLLKIAAENGPQRIRQFNADRFFQERRKKRNRDVLDFVIVGAGPSGVAAGLEAQKHDYQFKILEASRAFSTIINFPKAKPIYAEPEDMDQSSPLKIQKDVKESLLEDLRRQVGEQTRDQPLPLVEGANVENIAWVSGDSVSGDYFEVETGKGRFKALRVLLALGKTGNARGLGVPGEDLEKVFNRLIDPQDAGGHDVLVVGGGDSALETAIAVSETAKSVTLSYRKADLARPKQGNIDTFNRLVQGGEIQFLPETNVKTVGPDHVVLTDKNKKTVTLVNSMVFTMIGTQLPLDFFKAINVKIEGVLSTVEKWMFFALLMFSGVVYFGKSSAPALLGTGGGTFSWVEFLVYPFRGGFFENVNKWNWTGSLYGFIGYFCFVGFLVSGVVLLVHLFKSVKTYTATAWKAFKYGYFIGTAIFFCYVYVAATYFGVDVLGRSPGFWYTFLYSLTILVFGLRRMGVKPTGYIKRQTWTLILVQVFPLFLLPEIILPLLHRLDLLGGETGFLLSQVFPGADFGHAYRLILAWPLNIYGLFSEGITGFWLVYSILFSFGLIPFMNYLWGKGAYCGWICSCGALAETLGDEYRTLAPHGEKAKRWENIGQLVLLVAFVMTGLKLLSVLVGIDIPFIHTPRPFLLDFSRMLYSIVVDVIFAGVLGVGVYFFLSGRIWCRYFCPLAALMHIYTRFTRYRIFSRKKKCISCNICTRVCHMGIDVMSYANKGVPMGDVECVRCSACVVNCPMGVLYFGAQPGKDVDNVFYKTGDLPEFDDSRWRQGLK